MQSVESALGAARERRTSDLILGGTRKGAATCRSLHRGPVMQEDKQRPIDWSSDSARLQDLNSRWQTMCPRAGHFLRSLLCDSQVHCTTSLQL